MSQPNPNAEADAAKAAIARRQAKTAAISYAYDVTSSLVRDDVARTAIDDKLLGFVDAGLLTSTQVLSVMKSVRVAAPRPSVEERDQRREQQQIEREAARVAARKMPSNAEIAAMTPSQRKKLWEKI